MRRTAGVALAALLVFSLSTPASAKTAAPTRKPATPPLSKRVADAQRKANAAAARFAAAQSAVAKVERELAEINARAAATRKRLAALEGDVKQLAVRQYVQGGGRLDWLGSDDLSEVARSQAMIRFVRLGSADAVDEYRAARADLADAGDDLERAARARRAVLGQLRAQRAAAMKEVNRLAALQRAEEAKLAAASRARGRPTPRASRSEGGVTGVIATGEWVCPVQGPRSFSNDWGQPRSGGRRHQGNDILAPRGTPVVASVSGVVRHHNSSRGGLSYYLSGSDGHTYFGTHLSGFAASGRVAAGTVVGYVGTTGNASGGPPHLHFEIHPGGGAPTNPYPTLRAHC